MPKRITQRQVKQSAPLLNGDLKSKEKINHPNHYGGNTTYETIKVIETWGLGFLLGNAIKYISRADKKGNRLEDLKKAKWYLDREIENAS